MNPWLAIDGILMEQMRTSINTQPPNRQGLTLNTSRAASIQKWRHKCGDADSGVKMRLTKISQQTDGVECEV